MERVDLKSVLARDLNPRLESSTRRDLKNGERAVIRIIGDGRSLVATNMRVLVERPGEPPIALTFRDVTDLTGSLPMVGRRTVELKTAEHSYEIAVSLRGRRAAQRGVIEMTALLDEQNGWDDPANPARQRFMSSGWGIDRNMRRRRPSRAR